MTRRLWDMLGVGLALAIIMILAPSYNAAPQPEEQPKPPITQEATGNETEPDEDPMIDDKIALAQTVWGEARGCSTVEQAAVVWCVLNRLDSGDPYYAACKTPLDIVAQPAQFAGYDPDNPVLDDIYALVEDVLDRWAREKDGETDVGRVLPKEYLYFTGNGRENIFTTGWHCGDVWDWSAPNPYKEDL